LIDVNQAGPQDPRPMPADMSYPAPRPACLLYLRRQQEFSAALAAV